MGYLMLRPLLSDVPEDDMCGVTVNQVFPANETWHSLLLQALSGIPDVKAGDSVWWHSDMIHSVAPVTNQQGWGNVMYIPAASRDWMEGEGVPDRGCPGRPMSGRPGHRDQARSNRSRFMTLSHAATKSRTNFSFASSHA
jgi:hypothetical protein